MARPRPTPRPVVPTGMVASAVQLPTVRPHQAGQRQAWQTEAWELYDQVGELRFVANWVGNVMSRAKLVAAKRVKVNDRWQYVPEQDGPGAEAMSAFFGGPDGQEAMLAAAGCHLTVSGEGYVVMRSEESWSFLANDKVSQGAVRTSRDGRPSADISADFGDGGGAVLLSQDDTLVFRIWTPHPREPYRADSPVRSNLSTLREIVMCSEHVHAQLTSRLAGAGILWIPNDITLPTPKESAASTVDQFMEMLGGAMLTPIQDRSNASAVVPIVVQAPGEFLDKIHHLTFWSDLDDKTLEMRRDAVRILAVGLDTPQEVLLGVQDANHWNAWLVDESAVKSHLEPRLAVVANAVTTGYLRPALTDMPGVTPSDYVVLADTASVRMRPNRSAEAIQIYDRGWLSGEALLRETGFDVSDMPSGDEQREWLLRKIATGSTSPEQTQAALKILGADLGLQPAVPKAAQGQIPPALEPRRATDDQGGRALPDPVVSIRRAMQPAEVAASAALVAASEALVYRALERAGNRLCNGKARADGLDQVPAHRRYLHAAGDLQPTALLEGSWTFAEDILGNYTPKALAACVVVDTYVRYLLEERKAHSIQALIASLLAAGLITTQDLPDLWPAQ